MHLARRPPAFNLRTLKKLVGREEAGGVEGQPGARGGGEGAEEEDIKWADGGVRGLKTRVERKCSISRQKARLYGGGIHVGGV